ncbi:aldehyde dehydrogenase [Haloferula helveola]|uniref:Aldehyde dehydrogenase n=1 Tax=Haloferula helveola TaxID=490095 RepID=A0ABM7RJP6_9BACT|nr:aldehyde dehydrogenase [Haloferula helveola]
MNLPILRLGQTYESCDRVELDLGDGKMAVTHTANPGLIRRDLLRATEAKAALDAIPADTLASYCEQAAELFMTADLPCGDDHQSPQQYVESLSALTRLPHSLVRMNMTKIHAAMSQVRTVINGLTRNMPLEIFDRGLASAPGSSSDLALNYFPATSSLGVSLPSNAPAVNSLWIPAPVMKIPVFLKPGREDPFTPLRIVQAMIQAGFPKEAFGFYPTTHEGGDTIVTCCGRGISFGSDATVKKYADYPSVSVHGTGRSKILIGEDMIDRWPEFLDVIVQSISANGGRSCINTSAILVPSKRDELADALAAKLAEIQPLARDDENALLCGFANTALADGIDDLISAHLKEPGAEDVTAEHRDTPRKVEAFEQTYLQPTLVSCSDPEHPLANTEFMFPYASIVEIPQSEMLANIGQTLVVSAFTEDPDFIGKLLLSPDIERLNLGAFPTNRVQWEQPHEGNLFEFLYHRRAIQGNVAVA